MGRDPGGGDLQDLGNVAVLPGLVNAHAHLEFSDLREPLGEPGIGFVDWIRLIIDLFRRTSGTSPQPVQRGLQECIRSGTTTLGEIAQPDWSADQFAGVALQSTVFLELIAPTPDRIAPLLDPALRHVQSCDPPGTLNSGHWSPGLSPHAPYSVVAELLETAVSLSATWHVPIAFHLAESREELELLRSGSGPFRDRFEELGTCDPELFAPGMRPLDYLRTLAAGSEGRCAAGSEGRCAAGSEGRSAAAHRTLIVHGNYLDDEEIAFLAERAERMAVVYCPRTHAYFGHDPYPLEKMLAAGVTLALGTDGRASSPDLSLLAEMRFVAERYPNVGRDVVLQLGTIRAARALGRDHEVGSIQPGKYANLAVITLPDRDAADPHDLLFNSHEPVVGTWYRAKKVM